MRNFTFMILFITILAVQSCGSKKTKFDATGTFEATEVIVASETMGKLQNWIATEGLQVDPSVVLGVVDTTQLDLRKKEMLGQIAANNSRYTDVPKQIAGIKQEIANLNREKARFEKLVSSKAGTQKQVDDINYRINVLSKELIAKETLINTGNTVISDESSALSYKVDQINDLLEKSYIKSPIKGTVLTKYAEQGELMTPGKAMLKVADMENLFLRAYVTSKQLASIKLQQEVAVFADFGDETVRNYKGVITWISEESEFTPKTIQTDDGRANLVYAVKIAVKNDGYIKRGMYGEVKF